MDRDSVMMADACGLAIAILAYKLDEQGHISLADYIEALRNSADAVEAQPNRSFNEISATMLRRIAEYAEIGPDKRKARWTPSVIEGGQSDPPEDH